MQPGLIQPAGWDQLSRLMVYLYLFTGLGLTSVLSLLMARAIIPSLVASGEIPRFVQPLRWPLFVLFFAAAGLAIYASWNVVELTMAFIKNYYPRALI